MKRRFGRRRIPWRLAGRPAWAVARALAPSWKSVRSKYEPHQGEQERARRRVQRGLGVLRIIGGE